LYLKFNMAITIEGKLVCYSCIFDELNCNDFENACRITQMVFTVIFGIGLFVCLIRSFHYRNFNALVKAQSTQHNKIFIEKKRTLFILTFINNFALFLSCLLLACFTSSTAPQGLYVFAKILLDFIIIVTCLQYITIFTSWVEVLSVFKNLDDVDPKIELVKKWSKVALFLILICLLLFFCALATDLQAIAIGDLVFYGVVVIYIFVILCALSIIGVKLVKLMLVLNNFDNTTRAVTYNIVGLVIYFTIVLCLVVPIIFTNAIQKNYLIHIVYTLYYIFSMVIVFVYAKLE